MTDKQMLCFVTAGMVGGVTSMAVAQPFKLNGSGATLQEAFFEAPAATNDFLDCDGDSVIGDQLAVPDQTFPFVSTQYWQFDYRVVGSGNGFAELRDWGLATYATAVDGDAANGTLNSSFSDRSFLNRDDYVTGGGLLGFGNAANPGGMPFRSLDDGTFAVTTGTGAGTGVHMDIASLDVPVKWFVIQPGTIQYNRVPGTAGYGDNPRPATDKKGQALGQGNKLKSLVGLNGTINTNTANPNANTVFDTNIFLAPVAAPVNYGVGYQEMLMSDIRYLMATGRTSCGENLVAVTRDSGSGTRNAFSNGICLDPSFCVGENIGDRNSNAMFDILGPDWLPSNKGSSSRLDNTVRNHRLAIGHTGAERGESSGWLIAHQMEVLGVIADIKGGNTAARPSLDNILDGSVNGYNIIGPAGIATVGDPRNENMIGGTAGNTNPAPANVEAASFVNNITRSVAAFVTVPGGDETLFSPGELLASRFLLSAAPDFIPDPDADENDDCIPPIANPDLNQDLQDFIRNDSGNILGLEEFVSWDTTVDGGGNPVPANSAGAVPTRTVGPTYSDGVAGGTNYVNQGGANVAYGGVLARRNLIAFDFDGDGVRDCDGDITHMLRAWDQRHGSGTPWAAPAGSGIIAGEPGSAAIIEVLGDATGDGSFDESDICYFADGLYKPNNKLDRCGGFMAIDDESLALFGNGNFFGTALATGKTYHSGDTRGDVDSSVANCDPTRGHNPTKDGVVNADDLDYICAQFQGLADGSMDWADLSDAVLGDLSCDMDGDCDVDCYDHAKVVYAILGTQYGDVNLDGVVNATDIGIITANQGMMSAGWADGDMNCDGMVDATDLAIANAPASVCKLADINQDGNINGIDVGSFLSNYSQGIRCVADLNGDGSVNGIDIGVFLSNYSQCL